MGLPSKPAYPSLHCRRDFITHIPLTRLTFGYQPSLELIPSVSRSSGGWNLDGKAQSPQYKSHHYPVLCPNLRAHKDRQDTPGAELGHTQALTEVNSSAHGRIHRFLAEALGTWSLNETG